jgi:endonuclease/exonuclease/phosphatase family metal-dependent hydrolase
MHAGRGDLPRLLGDLTAGRLTRSRPSALVLMLQEAVDCDGNPPSTVDRLRPFGIATYFVPVREIRGRPYGNAIMTSLALVNRGVIPLPRERQPRSAAVAHIEVAGTRLFVASVHLENRVSWLRGGVLADHARRRQAEALVEGLPRNESGILGGDLNTQFGPGEAALLTLLVRFPDTPPVSRADVTFHDRLALDHLLFDLPAGWTVNRRVLMDAYGSDHHPVLGIVRTAEPSQK